MNDVRLPLEFFLMLEKMPSWRVKRLVSHVRVYAATGFVEDVKPKLWEAFLLAKALAIADLLTGIDKDVICNTVVGAGMILTEILVGIQARIEEENNA